MKKYPEEAKHLYNYFFHTQIFGKYQLLFKNISRKVLLFFSPKNYTDFLNVLFKESIAFPTNNSSILWPIAFKRIPLFIDT